MMMTDGVRIYRCTDGGCWTREVKPNRPPHRCDLPVVDEGLATGSTWKCSRCDIEWRLESLGGGAQPYGFRHGNAPLSVGPDGSTWVAWGRRNRKIYKRSNR